VIEDYRPIALDPNGLLLEQLADADGDGVADSKWIGLPDTTSSKGKPIYAAIRIIDNSAMLNANTAYKFSPNADGSSQLQINLMAMANRPGRPITPPGEDEVALLAERADYRFGNNPVDLPRYEIDLTAYEPNVIWRYGSPVGAYTPFDIGDELELRYRFLVNHEDIRTRIEQLWTWSFNSPTELNTPIRRGGASNLTDWFYGAQHDVIGPNDVYSYRHIATAYNIDRIITPSGSKMLNVNTADEGLLYSAIYSGLYDANFMGIRTNPVASQAVAQAAAQIAVNLIDFRDNDSNVTAYLNPADNKYYYGFESPCIYISEITYNEVNSPSPNPGEPNIVFKSYAIELHKPYLTDTVTPGWQLLVGSTRIDVNEKDWNALPTQFYVIQKEEGTASFTVAPSAVVKDFGSLTFTGRTRIELQRPVPGGYVIVDSVQVPDPCDASGWLTENKGARSIERDIAPHKSIRRLWADRRQAGIPTLGTTNGYKDTTRPQTIQAHPYLDPSIYQNKGFKNIGEIGMVLCKSAYSGCPNPVGPTDTEATADVNLADPNFQRIFNYLTVFDPIDHNQPSSETKIKGRININTAPWFVIAQLPWIQPLLPGAEFTIAQAIVAYRDKTLFSAGPDYRNRPGAIGFRSIGELMNVAEMGYYSYDSIDLGGFPDLTPNDDDSAQRNFEERDIIFHRISNLVTVRSDVFTAYILVRIGVDGPQKRVIAILDRSQVYSHDGKVKIIAIQPVPDPR